MRFVLRSLQPCWKTSSVNENPAYPACQVIIAALCRVRANSPSPHAARSAVSRDIRAAQSSPKLKDLFWTRTSRLFTPQVIIFALGYSTRLGRSGTALGYSAGAALGYITRAQHLC